MPTSDDIERQQGLLDAHRETLAHYLIQQARLGKDYAPPGVSAGIREARKGIARIKKVLHLWGVEVQDLPDDKDVELIGAIAAINVDTIKSRIDELVDILNDRAEKIERYVSKHFSSKGISYDLSYFKNLHQRHIECLKTGNLIRAHETLTDIYRVLKELQHKEFQHDENDIQRSLQSISETAIMYTTSHSSFSAPDTMSSYIGNDIRRSLRDKYSNRYSNSEWHKLGYDDKELKQEVAVMYGLILLQNGV